VHIMRAEAMLDVAPGERPAVAREHHGAHASGTDHVRAVANRPRELLQRRPVDDARG
jgi:hypothetical protein